MKLAAAQQSLEVPTSRRRGGGLLLDGVLRSSSSSMVDSTSEVLAADDQDTMGSLVMPPHGRPLTSATSGVGACLQQQLRAESGPRLQFCVAPESPAGPLSRGESEESLGGEPFFNANSASCGRLGSSTMGLKRQLEDADKEAWMDLRAQKSPKLLPQEEKALVFQDHNHSAVYGSVPSSFGVSYLNPTARSAAIAAAGIPNGSAAQSASLFAAAAPPGLSHEIELGDGDNLPNKVASMRAILFRASLPLPTAAEIESSRPKRRNVRISKDPQSVAARHRRERISDRIRVLQRLVPGGTKMDTASMLDEAIHYVKFLKLQLQTLEQLGNGSCDLRYNGAIGGQSSLVPPTRPFDLNCAVYNQVTSSCEPGAPLVTTVSLSTDSPATSHLSSEVWPSATSVSRHFGGPGQFSDPLQEQFCH